MLDFVETQSCITLYGADCFYFLTNNVIPVERIYEGIHHEINEVFPVVSEGILRAHF